MEELMSPCSCSDSCCNCCYICRREMFERLRAKAWGIRPKSPMQYQRSDSRASVPNLNIILRTPRTRRPATSRFGLRLPEDSTNKEPRKVRAASAYGRLEMATATPRASKKTPKHLQQDDAVTPALKVATFCDWSHNINEGTSSLASSYDRPTFPHRHPTGARVTKMKQYYSTGIRMLSGRFFVKEKTTLTKGEREIISGIVQNRGDIQAEEAFEDFSNPGGLQSHRDAWLLGKNFNRLSHPMIRGDDPYTCNCHFQGHRNDTGCMNCNPSKRFCQQCCAKALKVQSQERVASQQQRKDLDVVLPVPVPPVSITEEWTKKRRIPPINSSKGAVYVKNMMYRNKDEPSYFQKRTMLDVYLPRLDAMAAGVSHEPPAPPSSPVPEAEQASCSWMEQTGITSESDSEGEYSARSSSLDLASLRTGIDRIEENTCSCLQVMRPFNPNSTYVS